MNSSYAKPSSYQLDQIAQGIFTYSIATGFVAACWMFFDVFSQEPLIALTFTIILALSAGGLVLESTKAPCSLFGVHLLFIAVYFGVAAPMQAVNRDLPYVFGFVVSDDDIVRANIVIITWLGFCLLTRTILDTQLNTELPNILRRPITIRGLQLILILSIFSFALLGYLGLFGVFTRGAQAEAMAGSSTSGMLMATVVGRAIPLLSTLTLLLLWRKTKSKSYLYLLLAFGGCTFLFANPLAAARYWTGMAIIAFVVAAGLKNRTTGCWLYGSLIVGVLIVMPLANAGRGATDVAEFAEEMEVEVSSDSLLTGDAESFSALLRVLYFTVEHDGFQHGRQLAGALFGWIPRSLWADKPIGSGAFVGEMFGYAFTNVGCPIPAEFFIDFGYAGLIAGACLWTYALTAFDRWSMMNSTGITVIDVIYPFWIGLVFFISRGDLLSSLTYTFGVTICSVPLMLGGPSLTSQSRFDEPSL